MDIVDSWDYGTFSNIFNNIFQIKEEKYPLTYKIIQNNFYQIIENIINEINREDDLRDIPLLFMQFNISYSDYIDSINGRINISDCIERVMMQKEEDELNNIYRKVTSIDTIEDIYHDLEYEKDYLIEELLPKVGIENDFDLEYDEEEWMQTIQDNLSTDPHEEYRDYSFQKVNIKSNNSEDSSNSEIDDLFN
ncbi:hypothetical protein RM553_19060 [Zunongwangia sp. F363]|uniref:Uncharacterized protein n=1 Tax=Autumnicola tepida TaxID=3075595 RepID=A0ABU3CF30_9FLAO|nr:hypothetical protein [Zunongwangia sp. F363]MDT0644940.1 hypothetical protein [Zunongwangia sp. F363]